MNILELKNISKRFPEARDWAVEDFSLDVTRGEIIALLGESGCGKTTILRMIAGFEKPTSGMIHLNSELVAGNGVFTEPQKRKVGIVFQDYALFPHKTVWQNISFGLFNMSADASSQKAHDILELCGLTGLEKRYPHQLSGGQKQRVALARAMAPEPGIILFDEPFSNIDSMRKNQMRDDILEIIRKTNATAIFVTHDTKDVLAMADKVAVMRHGKALQTDTPETVYNFPVNSYVADFFGKTNIIRAQVTEKGFVTPAGLIRTPHPPSLKEQEVIISIRPEQFHIAHYDTECLCGDVIKERFLGEYKELTCNVINHEGEKTEIVIYTSPQHVCNGNKCYFKTREGKINIMKPDK
jgi:iron(III) transport system ATP-binding protein